MKKTILKMVIITSLLTISFATPINISSNETDLGIISIKTQADFG